MQLRIGEVSIAVFRTTSTAARKTFDASAGSGYLPGGHGGSRGGWSGAFDAFEDGLQAPVHVRAEGVVPNL